MNGNSQPKKQIGQNSISEETLRELLAVQRQKLEVDLKQAEIANRQQDQNMKLADKTISAQLEDRKDARTKQIQKDRNTYVFIGAVIGLILLFSVYALSVGKEAIVLDLVKLIVGFAGGFGFGWYKRSKKQNTETEEE